MKIHSIAQQNLHRQCFMTRGGFTARAGGAAARAGTQKYKEQVFIEQPKNSPLAPSAASGLRILPPAQASDTSLALNVKIQNSASSRTRHARPPNRDPVHCNSAHRPMALLCLCPCCSCRAALVAAGHCLPLLGRPNLQRRRVNIPCLPSIAHASW
jgi:hypothetical protein